MAINLRSAFTLPKEKNIILAFILYAFKIVTFSKIRSNSFENQHICSVDTDLFGSI